MQVTGRTCPVALLHEVVHEQHAGVRVWEDPILLGLAQYPEQSLGVASNEVQSQHLQRTIHGYYY